MQINTDPNMVTRKVIQFIIFDSIVSIWLHYIGSLVDSYKDKSDIWNIGKLGSSDSSEFYIFWFVSTFLFEDATGLVLYISNIKDYAKTK